MANTPDLRREGMERVESDPYYGGGGWHKQLWRVQAKQYVGGPEFNTPTIPELRVSVQIQDVDDTGATVTVTVTGNETERVRTGDGESEGMVEIYESWKELWKGWLTGTGDRAILTRNHHQRDQCRARAQSPSERIRSFLPGTSLVGYQASRVRIIRVISIEQLRHKSSLFYSISHHISYSTPRATPPAFSLFACFRPPTRTQITDPVPRTPLGLTSTSTECAIGNAFQIRDGVATVAGYAGVTPARSVPATGGWWGKERRWKCGTSGDSALAIAGARTVAGRRAMRGMASRVQRASTRIEGKGETKEGGARRGVGAVAGRCGNGAGRPKASGSVVVTACGDGRNRVLHRERRYRRGWWREGRWREKWGARAACTADGDLGRTGIGRATTASKTLDYTPMKGAGARTAYGKRHGYVVDGDQWRRVVSGRG
ncbi:hypothetical protein B0H14DRAFT_3133089 [Mycena olivaceomarginata]|nr:hypothetical protein B0H14DRAFT_3133089 [Mycena olivaceomarginata]